PAWPPRPSGGPTAPAWRTRWARRQATWIRWSLLALLAPGGPELSRGVAARHLQVVFRDDGHPGQVLVCHFADHLSRHAHHQRPRRYLFPLADQSAGGDDAARADLGASQQRRPHADKSALTYKQPVQGGAVPDHDALLDHLRLVRVGVDDR